MASIPINPLRHCKQHTLITAHSSSRTNSRIFTTTTTVCCRNRDPNPKGKKVSEQDKGIWLPKLLQQMMDGVEKVGKGVRDELSPNQKGDWKDITLMSLSFAVYIYMSQKIVCAYCVWVSMSRQPW